MATAEKPSIARLFLTFLKLGFTAFGGPAMQVQIRKEIVEHKKWMDANRFDAGLALCQVIPGAIIMQVAAYVGLKLKGIPGSILCFIAFGLPSFLIMIALSILYKNYHHLDTIEAILSTLRIIIVAIIAHSTYTFGKKNLNNINDVGIAFVAALLFLIKLHPALVVIIAIGLGLLISRKGESRFQSTGKDKTFRYFLFLFGLVIFSLILFYIFAPNYFTLVTIMLRIDLFSFGGGLAAVPMMYHELVDLFGWLDKKTLFDGIILGQVTPGSIIVTATFAGYYHLGLMGGIVATIFVFTPSYLILMATIPFFDRLSYYKNFSRAINGILCSFVGLLLITTVNFGYDISWDPEAIIICLISLILLLLRVNVGWLIAGGLLLSFFNI